MQLREFSVSYLTLLGLDTDNDDLLLAKQSHIRFSYLGFSTRLLRTAWKEIPIHQDFLNLWRRFPKQLKSFRYRECTENRTAVGLQVGKKIMGTYLFKLHLTEVLKA